MLGIAHDGVLNIRGIGVQFGGLAGHDDHKVAGRGQLALRAPAHGADFLAQAVILDHQKLPGLKTERAGRQAAAFQNSMKVRVADFLFRVEFLAGVAEVPSLHKHICHMRHGEYSLLSSLSRVDAVTASIPV